jgi:hypothetical protein
MGSCNIPLQTWCYKGITGCYEGVTRVPQGCHKGVTRVLQECYKGVTRVLPSQYPRLCSVEHKGKEHDCYVVLCGVMLVL